MQVTYLVKRWQHHTPSGGYDRLAQVMGGTSVARAGRGGFADRALRHLWRKFSDSKSYLLDYKDEDWIAEWRLLAQNRIRKADVVHVLYGDEQLDVLLRYRRWLACPLVATFHLPTSRDSVVERFEKFHRPLLGGLDAAVVVARNQLPDFQRWFGSDRVVFIPHGIDTVRFSPPANPPGTDEAVRVVSVGEHMRDLEALHCIMDACREMKLPVKFDVVIPTLFHQNFYGCSNARFHTAISEDQLIALYRQADVLLLPIIDATANNAVLESMACGTPVISTGVGGMPDYVDESAGWLFPGGEVNGIVGLIQSGCQNRDVFRERRNGARHKALTFDWQQIKRQLSALYLSLRKGAGGRMRCD